MARPPGRQRTLRRDLTLGVLLTIVVCVAAVALSIAIFLSSRIERSLHRSAANTAGRLAEALAVPLFDLDLDQVRQIAEIFHRNSNVAGVQIVDLKGQVLCEVGSLQEDSSISQSQSIEHQGQRIGTVEVSLTTEPIALMKSNLSTSSIFLTVFLMVAVMIVLHYLMRRYLSQPLDALIEEIRVIAGGRYEHRLAPLRQLEINSIAEEINTMASAIQSRDESLREANEHLEERGPRSAALRPSAKVEDGGRTRARVKLVMGHINVNHPTDA